MVLTWSRAPAPKAVGEARVDKHMHASSSRGLSRKPCCFYSGTIYGRIVCPEHTYKRIVSPVNFIHLQRPGGGGGGQRPHPAGG